MLKWSVFHTDRHILYISATIACVYATFVVPIVVAINKIDKPEADVVSIVDRSSGRWK